MTRWSLPAPTPRHPSTWRCLTTRLVGLGVYRSLRWHRYGRWRLHCSVTHDNQILHFQSLIPTWCRRVIAIRRTICLPHRYLRWCICGFERPHLNDLFLDKIPPGYWRDIPNPTSHHLLKIKYRWLNPGRFVHLISRVCYQRQLRRAKSSPATYYFVMLPFVTITYYS